MRIRSAMLCVLTVAAGACSSRNATVESGTGGAVFSTGRAQESAADLPAGAKGATTNPNASTAARLGIPPGHLPAPGECRVWMPGEPPGKQKGRPSGDCGYVQTRVPPGGWLVWRPTGDKKEVVVREFGDDAVVRWTRVFDVVTGALLHEDARR
ncbi:MAG: hypothetical protein RRA92_08340 [Gemmatimonadota bacterium]|nr:hypothetical protein [Gemmatimonadota bacterium]